MSSGRNPSSCRHAGCVNCESRWKEKGVNMTDLEIVNRAHEQSAGQAGQLTAESFQSEIANWLKLYLAKILDLVPDEIDENLAFDRHGLDSSAAVGMSGDLGNWLGSEVDASVAFDHPSVAKMARALAADEKLLAAVIRRRELALRHGGPDA